MEEAQAAVQQHLARAGKHDTTVTEVINPAITNEHITPKQHTEVQTLLSRDVHEHTYHTSVQPILDSEVLPEQVIHRTADPVVRHFYHGHDGSVHKGLGTTWPTTTLIDFNAKGVTSSKIAASPVNKSSEFQKTTDQNAMHEATQGLRHMSIDNQRTRAPLGSEDVSEASSGTATVVGTETKRSFPLAKGDGIGSTLRPNELSSAASTTAISHGIIGNSPTTTNQYARSNLANPLNNTPRDAGVTTTTTTTTNTSVSSPGSSGRAAAPRKSVDKMVPREAGSPVIKRQSAEVRTSRDYGKSRSSVDGRKSRDAGRPSLDSNGSPKHKEGFMSKIKHKLSGHD